jgi:hypothetical protein
MTFKPTEQDLLQLKEKGISQETIGFQIENFKKGFPFAEIIAAATVENGGIKKFSDSEIESFITKYETALAHEKVVKFVPASGAASRMFKDLYHFMEKYQIDEDFFDINQYNPVKEFFTEIQKFAFYPELSALCIKNNVKIERDFDKVLELLLTEKGLNYGNSPKALLKFHQYQEKSRTSTEEHLTEGALYGNSNGKVNIHFTVSPEHLTKFKEHIQSVLPEYEKKFSVKYEITYSVQNSSTDTIAVEMNNEPFREKDGRLLFRPGGHGALIQNLNEIDADLIFVKNIDNVVPDRMREKTTVFKKAITGLLIKTREEIFNFLKQLNSETADKVIDEITDYLKTKLSIQVDREFNKKSNYEKKNYLIKKLNRPIRVCGMVRNEGEPGGGPYFVQSKTGSVSLQIIEGAEIDQKNSEKLKIVKSATHFNPVDLVLSVKNFQGKKYNLPDFVDPQTGFISIKSKDGKDLKAQELPGLWNGAMAFWNTIFVEVPVETFNPVKTVNDLLRKEHLQLM